MRPDLGPDAAGDDDEPENHDVEVDADLASAVAIVADMGTDLTSAAQPVDVTIVSAPPPTEAIRTDDGAAPPPLTEGPADRGGPLGAAVAALESTLTRRLDALQALFEREVRAEAAREKVVDRLHAELQEYKNDLLLRVMRPVFIDLIQLHDDMGKLAQARAEPEAQATRSLAEDVQQAIEDVLYRQGVEPFHVPDALFDPRRQRAVATVPTDDPARARTVAARHRKGFAAGEKVIRPELVSVYVQAPPSEPRP